MAIILKKDTFLQNKKAEFDYIVANKRQEVNEILKSQNSFKTVIKILISKWKNFIIFPILIPFTVHNYSYLMLTLFLLLVTVVLTIGYSKRPKEERARQLQVEIVDMAFSFAPWKKGLAGEQIVAKELSGLPDTYYVFNDVTVRLNKKLAQIDHIVVGPTGVFAIETKTMGGNLRPHPNGWLQGRTLIRSPQQQSIEGAQILSRLINHRVQAVVALTNPKARWLGGFDPICPVLYSGYLRGYILEKSTTVPDPTELVEKIQGFLH